MQRFHEDVNTGIIVGGMKGTRWSKPVDIDLLIRFLVFAVHAHRYIVEVLSDSRQESGVKQAENKFS